MRRAQLTGPWGGRAGRALRRYATSSVLGGVNKVAKVTGVAGMLSWGQKAMGGLTREVLRARTRSLTCVCVHACALTRTHSHTRSLARACVHASTHARAHTRTHQWQVDRTTREMGELQRNIIRRGYVSTLQYP
jgi:hypothetical protein